MSTLTVISSVNLRCSFSARHKLRQCQVAAGRSVWPLPPRRSSNLRPSQIYVPIETSLTACGKCLEISRRLRNPDPPDSIQLSPLIMMLSCSASWMSSCSSVSMIPIITPYVDLIRAQLQAMSGRYPRVWISDAISFASKPGSPSVSHSLTSAKRA